MRIQLYSHLEFGGYIQSFISLLIWRNQDSTIEKYMGFLEGILTVTKIVNAEYDSILYSVLSSATG